MTSDKEVYGLIAFGLAMGLMVGIFFGFVIDSFDHTNEVRFYRQGQIDALSGQVKFELREQPDKSVVWVEKK